MKDETGYILDANHLNTGNKHNSQALICDGPSAIPNSLLSLKREQEGRQEPINTNDARNPLALFLGICLDVLSKISMEE